MTRPRKSCSVRFNGLICGKSAFLLGGRSRGPRCAHLTLLFSRSAFHCSWWSFFIAFFIWFAIGPLLPYIRKDLGLTNQEIWTSSIAGVGSTILVRFALGPLCDVYGARVLFSIILCVASIPTALTGLIQDAKGLIILRSFIGIAGGSFVMCQYWTR